MKYIFQEVKKSMFLILIVRKEQTKLRKTNFISVSLKNERTWSLTNYEPTN